MVGIPGAVRSCKQLQVIALLGHISTMMSDLDRTALCVVGEKIWLPSRDVRSELLIVLHVSLQIPDPFRRCIWSSQLARRTRRRDSWSE